MKRIRLLIPLLYVTLLAGCGLFARPTPPPFSRSEEANTPEDAVRSMLVAAEEGNAAAYLQAVDPAYRERSGFYFTAVLIEGIQSNLGIEETTDAAPVAFQSLGYQTTNGSGESANVYVTGKLDSPALGGVTDFSWRYFTRKINGRWYVSEMPQSEGEETIADLLVETATPKPSAVPTHTPRVSSTPVFRPTIESEQTPTATPTQTVAPVITYTTDRTQIIEEQCVTIRWSAANVTAVYFYEQGQSWQEYPVKPAGSSEVCPADTTTYELLWTNDGAPGETRQLTIHVQPKPGAPIIERFTLNPADQIATGSCVDINWQVVGHVNEVTLYRNQTVLKDSLAVSGTTQDCPSLVGRINYTIEASGAGGTSSLQRVIVALSPSPRPSAAPPKATATLPQPTAAVPQPTATIPQPTATLPHPTATIPQPTATIPQPTATVPQPTATVPPATATAPQPTAAVPPATTAPPPPSAALQYRVTAVSSDDVLNMRSAPGVGSSIVGFIAYDGSGIDVLGPGAAVEDKLWVPVIYGGISGWVNARYLWPVAGEDAAYRVTNVQSDDVLNVRVGPGAGNVVAGTIPHNGANVHVIRGGGLAVEGSLWAPAAYQGVFGWANMNYLEAQ